MAFGGLSDKQGEPMADMNVIPLVDIMLVLLVIFIITAPVLTHAVKIDMPQASSEPNLENPDTVSLTIDAYSHVYWNDTPLGFSELEARLQRLALDEPDTHIQLRADKQTPYEIIARIMAASSRAGITNLGFVMEPE
jgi:biopolymer transport protein ExbD